MVIVPVEFASPVYLFDDNKHWKNGISDIFDSFRGCALINTHQTCATHVHFSPTSDWTLEMMQKTSHCAIWFEPALQVIYPEGRRLTKWAKANYADNPRFYESSVFDAMEQVESVETIQALIDCMNPFRSRPWAWNFVPVEGESALGTVEFRKPPGVTTALECDQWITLTMVFVEAAVRIASHSELSIKYAGQEVKDLKNFLATGSKNNKTLDDTVGSLLEGKFGKLEVQTVGKVSMLEVRAQRMLRGLNDDEQDQSDGDPTA